MDIEVRLSRLEAQNRRLLWQNRFFAVLLVMLFLFGGPAAALRQWFRGGHEVLTASSIVVSDPTNPGARVDIGPSMIIMHNGQSAFIVSNLATTTTQPCVEIHNAKGKRIWLAGADQHGDLVQEPPTSSMQP